MGALIWSPFADRIEAKRVAQALIKEGLVACVNMFEIDSVFLWNGDLAEGRECGALFKTRADLLDRAVVRIEQLHTYETPLVLGWLCDRPGKLTADWFASLSGRNGNEPNSAA